MNLNLLKVLSKILIVSGAVVGIVPFAAGISIPAYLIGVLILHFKESNRKLFWRWVLFPLAGILIVWLILFLIVLFKGILSESDYR